MPDASSASDGVKGVKGVKDEGRYELVLANA